MEKRTRIERRRTLSWKPVRRGSVYCSSACGAGCTWLQYLEMREQGRTMRNLMDHPKQWRVCVRENMRWYVLLEHIPTDGRLTVWIHRSGRYSVLLSLDMPHAGDYDWTDDKTFRSPQAAVDYMVEKSLRVMDAKRAILAKMCSATT